MTFDEILDQVITLLKRQGRVSYPALKVRFSLDDEYLEAIKAEIIEAQQLATDENGRVLVWTGDTVSEQAIVPQPAQTTPQPAAQEQHFPLVETRPTVPPSPPDAERRQLTVMFCDLVESTKLSTQLDPEDLREVVRAYQKTCSTIIAQFDGHVAQLLGDGLLIYFGYPHAHEDDAHRAVRTGLGILAAMGDLNIQGLAVPNTVAISEATHRLVQGYFAYQALGAQTLRGVSEPIAVYYVLQESGTRSVSMRL